MKIAVTGASGFIGSNLVVRLRETGRHEVVPVPHAADDGTFAARLAGAGFVFHLAGVNRPPDPSAYDAGNSDFTRRLVATLERQPAPPRVAFASSTQAALDNAYGRSKRAAEDALAAYAARSGAAVHLMRLPNVFGKWCRPDYNSVVATFCHRIARGLPITVHDPAAPLRLLYVDDAVDAMLALADGGARPGGTLDVGPAHETTVGRLADQIRAFRDSRDTLLTERVGSGLVRALYATYVSHLPEACFDYAVPRHADPRGDFVEMLKTPDCGQFSYFTAHPGVTRGGHYHHSKTEKFLVIAGSARFGFRHVVTQRRHELVVRGGEARIVETVPGWTHDITNIGDDMLVVMLWANEIFDRTRPDTVALKVDP